VVNLKDNQERIIRTQGHLTGFGILNEDWRLATKEEVMSLYWLDKEEVMKTNIPQYRAKKIDNDEYVEGQLSHYISQDGSIWDDEGLIIHTRIFYDIDDKEQGYYYSLDKIDPSTLAIHFPDMKDSEGTKIFASLSEDGKGGDRIKWLHGDDEEYYVYHNTQGTFNKGLGYHEVESFGVPQNMKVTGIQE